MELEKVMHAVIYFYQLTLSSTYFDDEVDVCVRTAFHGVV